MSARDRNAPSAYTPTLKEQRPLLAGMTFANQQVEQRILAAFDDRLSKAVGRVEGRVIEGATALRKEIHTVSQTADEVREELAEMQRALDNDEPIDLERWARLDAAVGMLAADSAKYAARVDAVIARLEDPLAYASSLQERFASLHRPDLVSEAIAEATSD